MGGKDRREEKNLLDKHVEIFRNLWCEAFSLSVHEPSRGFAFLFPFSYPFTSSRSKEHRIDRPTGSPGAKGFDFI